MSIKKDAVKFAKEMIEHGYLGQMSSDEIVDKSCDMAYKIHEKVKSYSKSEPITEKDIRKIMSEHSAKPINQSHHPM